MKICLVAASLALFTVHFAEAKQPTGEAIKACLENIESAGLRREPLSNTLVTKALEMIRERRLPEFTKLHGWQKLAGSLYIWGSRPCEDSIKSRLLDEGDPRSETHFIYQMANDDIYLIYSSFNVTAFHVHPWTTGESILYLAEAELGNLDLHAKFPREMSQLNKVDPLESIYARRFKPGQFATGTEKALYSRRAAPWVFGADRSSIVELAVKDRHLTFRRSAEPADQPMANIVDLKTFGP